MIAASDIKEHVGPYVIQFERFDREAGAGQPMWLRDLRERAMGTFARLGFPSTRDEAWRFTNVSPLARTFFASADEGEQGEIGGHLLSGGLGAFGPLRLVVVNGRYAREISGVAAWPDGVSARGLREALSAEPDRLAPYLGRFARIDHHPFRALNTAFLDDGVVIEVAPGQVIDDPIDIIYLSSPAGVPAVAHPRALIIAGERSEVRFVETFLSAGDDRHFTNAVTEIVAGPGAVIEHARIGLENSRAYHLGGTHAELHRDSRYSSHVVVLGGEIVRHDVAVVLGGEGAHAALNGVTVAGGEALVDHHTELDHAAPHCSSHQVYKSVLGDRARGVFNGKIRVRPDAQKTDAKQTNKTLLLSTDAGIHTKPELEIFANDVKCTHGATVGQLSDEQWFYLRARGIGRDEARAMLIRAFAGEAIERIGSAAIRGRVERLLADRLDRMASAGVTHP